MEVGSKPGTKVKIANQGLRSKGQPFRQAFSPRKMTAPDFNVQRRPTTSRSRRDDDVEVPWYERELPTILDT
jgi:hypothetical protein